SSCLPSVAAPLRAVAGPCTPHVYEITYRYTLVANRPRACRMLDGMNSSLPGRLSRSLVRTLTCVVAMRPAADETAPHADTALPLLEPLVPVWPCSVEPLAGGRINVRYTDDAATPGVVYVHGLGGSATNWTDLAALLAPTAAGAAIDLP